MPYVNCPSCDVRSFALAPWSTVNTCPACDAPLTVRRREASRRPQPAYWAHSGSGSDSQPAGRPEATGTN